MLLNSFFKFRIVLFVALFPLNAVAIPSPPPSKAVEIQLEGTVKVGGEQVVLGDVAKIYSRSLQNFKELSNLVISKIPEDQSEVKLPARYLEMRIRAALPPGVEFALKAPEEIIFKLERLGLTGQDFATEVARMARAEGKIREGAEIEVVPLTGIEQLKGFNLANARIEPSAIKDSWKGEMAFKVTRADQEGGAPVWVRVRMRWFQNAWVANRAFKFAEDLDPSSFAEAKVETTNWREDPIGGSKEDLEKFLRGARVRRSLAANAPLLASTIERKPDAGPGSALRVEFISEGGVRVSAEGILVGAGMIGSDVKAKLRSSKKIVTGKMVSQNLVEVAL